MDNNKSGNTLGKMVGVILGIIYVVVWGFALVVFYGFGWQDEAMAFNILFIWVVLPVMNFIFALLLGRLNSGGWIKWVIPAFMGVMYMLLEYFTFSMANTAVTHSLNPPEWKMIIIGGVIAYVGMIIGAILRMKKAHDKAKRVEMTATQELPELEQLRDKETPEHVAKLEVVEEATVATETSQPVVIEGVDASDATFVEVPQEKE